MAECKATKFPFLSRVKLGDFGSSPLVDNSLYKQLVGILLYLTHSRTDLDHAEDVVSRYIQDPHEIHWNYVKIILHYVQGTKHFEIHYAASSPLELVGFSDLDWNGDPNERKSTSGFVFMLSNGPNFWSSKKNTLFPFLQLRSST